MLRFTSHLTIMHKFKRNLLFYTVNNNCHTQHCPPFFPSLSAKLQKRSIHPDGYIASPPQKQPRSIAFPAPLILCFMYLHIQGKRAALFLLCCKVTAYCFTPATATQIEARKSMEHFLLTLKEKA